jgi:hypothetical protein
MRILNVTKFHRRNVMQRREFLQGTLAIGATGMLLPGIELTGGQELSPMPEITQEMVTLMDEMEEYNRRAGHLKGTEMAEHMPEVWNEAENQGGWARAGEVLSQEEVVSIMALYGGDGKPR